MIKEKEPSDIEEKEDSKVLPPIDTISVQLKKIDELTIDLKRLQAEFENYKKRIDKQNSEIRDIVLCDFMKKLLPVLDSFELALKNNGCTEKEKLMKGMELIYAQLQSVFSEEGLRPIDAVNCKFDPYKHEILMQKDSEKEEGTIIEEFQKGYMLKDKVIRHSKVKVAKKEEKA